MTPRKILIIDDEENNQAISEWFLRCNDIECDIDFASNGREALDMIEQSKHKPDLILLDMAMPVMDGMEFIQAFNSSPHCSGAKVFIVTGYSSEEQTQSVLGYRFVSDIIPKPVTDASVKKILGHYMPV